MTHYRLFAVFLYTVFMQVVACAQTTSPQHQMVYKTRQNYSRYVAVELSPDKKTVTSYPKPADEALLKAPVALKDGYWTANNTLTVNTAFLAITKDDYRQLKHAAPTAADLIFLIKDKTPFTELWDCGVAGALSQAQLTALIEQNKLSTKCRKLK